MASDKYLTGEVNHRHLLQYFMAFGDHSEKKSDKISRYATETKSSGQQNIQHVANIHKCQCYLDVCYRDIYSNYLLVIIKDKMVKDYLGLSPVALNSHLLLNK